MTELHPRTLAMAVRAVAVLALDAPGQLEWLRSLGLGEPALCDEIAQEVGEAALLAPQFEAAGWIGAGTLRGLQQLDARLDELSTPGHDDFWAVDALAHDERWAALRQQARQLLASI